MKAALLDVNVLIALAWPSHLRHRSARAWFRRSAPAPFATCPTTQAGFVRVASNARILPGACTPREALGMLAEIAALERHEFWEDDTSLPTSPFIAADQILGHAQVTDAHLLALALRKKGRLATFDSGVRHLLPRGVRAEEVLEVLR